MSPGKYGQPAITEILRAIRESPLRMILQPSAISLQPGSKDNLHYFPHFLIIPCHSYVLQRQPDDPHGHDDDNVRDQDGQEER